MTNNSDYYYYKLSEVNEFGNHIFRKINDQCLFQLVVGYVGKRDILHELF